VDESTEANLRHWDERAPVHAASPDYGFDRFVADPAHLSDVVRFDRPRLGDVSGLRGVHLQCHIGTDTLSLSRLGARMTGLDFSGASIREARRLAEAAGADIDFVEADVRDAAEVLPRGSFDLVYTGIGALCWVPRIGPWARSVAALLRPGGRLFVREGHPMMWAMDEAHGDGTLLVTWPYVETPAPLVFDEPGTYVETDATLQHTVSHSWNHGIGEIIGAVLDAGLTLTQFVEHDSLPWNPFAEGALECDAHGEWRLRDRPERLPLSYTLQAVKPDG
jgi:SAM-dependent methyltransferase